MENYNRDTLAWCVTDGAAGNVSQVKGLASAMNLIYQEKKVILRFPWSHLPPGFFPIFDFAIKNKSDFMADRYPKYVITSGRKSIYLSLLLKRKLKDKVKTIHIQDPKINPKLFDHIIAPEHDHIKGPNVIKSKLAINHINEELMSSEAIKFNEDFKSLNKPIVTLILGGKSNNYTFDKAALNRLSMKIDKIIENNSVSLVILFSRRTDKFIKDFIAKKYSEDHLVWTNSQKNPYIALLKLSSCLICTGDSVSMISEAIYSRKPVYIFRLKSKKKNNRIDLFNEKLLALSYTKELSSNLIFDKTDYENETIKIAEIILKNRS